MSTIWFTADTHFGHSNIIQYTKRPFTGAKEMDETLIANWNAHVQPEDEVYHLGDFALADPAYCRKILSRLQGRIHLVTGNHEKAALACTDQFVWVKDYHELHVERPDSPRKQAVVLFHYAMRVWNASHHGSWQLYGHSHGTLPDDPTALAIDVGVDCHGYRPISYDEVATIMATKTWVPPFGDRAR
jgi:calcineurin-like phosphoesterase family protein